MADEDRKSGARKPPSERRFSPLWIVVGAVVIIACGATVITMMREHRSAPPSSVQSSSPQQPSSASTSLKSTSASYSSALSRQEHRQAKQADRSGQSYLTPAVSTATSANPQVGSSSFNTNRYASHPAASPHGTNNAYASTARAQSSGAGRNGREQQMAAAYLKEFNSIGVHQQAPGASDVVLVRAHAQSKASAAASSGSPHSVHASAKAGKRAHHTAAARLPGGLAAGKVYYAVEDLTLDSDSPGPVMATIVQGRFNGYKAMGSFKRQGGRLAVHFKQLVGPHGKVYPISAVAINPKTSKTAIRSAINHHYFSRWAGLIASSFLEGVGQAVGMSGQTLISTAGSTVITRPTLGLKDEALIAAGQVGAKAGQAMQNNFNRPPTVWLKAGTGLGVLILGSAQTAGQAGSS